MKCSQAPNGAVRHAGPDAAKGHALGARQAKPSPNSRKVRASPRPRRRGQPMAAASQSARFKRAPQKRPYMSVAASPTLIRTPPPAGLSTRPRACRPEKKPGTINPPPSGNLGSLALFMTSTIAHPLALAKRASAVVVQGSDFVVLSRAWHLRQIWGDSS